MSYRMTTPQTYEIELAHLCGLDVSYQLNGTLRLRPRYQYVDVLMANYDWILPYPRIILIHCLDDRFTATAYLCSPTQMYQSKLYENQKTQGGKRWYGGSQHFHNTTSSTDEEAYNGAQLVHSTMTEMISNVSPP